MKSKMINTHTHTHTHTWTVPSKSTDRLSLSLMSEMMSVQSDSGRADPRTMITRPGAEVAQWLCLLLTYCTFMLKNCDSLVFKPGDCFNTQGSPCWAAKSRWVHSIFIPPPTVVAGGIIFYCWSLFLFFLSPQDLRDGSTDREPF